MSRLQSYVNEFKVPFSRYEIRSLIERTGLLCLACPQKVTNDTEPIDLQRTVTVIDPDGTGGLVFDLDEAPVPPGEGALKYILNVGSIDTVTLTSDTHFPMSPIVLAPGQTTLLYDYHQSPGRWTRFDRTATPDDLGVKTLAISDDLGIPRYASLPVPAFAEGSIIYNTTDGSIYKSDGITWTGAGSSAITPALNSLNTIATGGTDRLAYTTVGGVYSATSITAIGRQLLGNSSSAQMQATLGLVPGVTIQFYSTALDSLSTVTTAANQMVVTTAPNSFTTVPSATFGRSLLNETTSTTARSTLVVPETTSPTIDRGIVTWNGITGTGLRTTNVQVSALDDITGINDISIGNDLNIVGTMGGIDSSERTQLANIDAAVISTTNWSHVSSLDQDLGTTDTPTFSGLNAGLQHITNLLSPSSDNEAATKGYVDSVAGAGLTPIDAVLLATDAVLPNAPAYADPAQTLTSTAGAGVQIVVDTTLGTTGDRILVKNEADLRWNGVYDITDDGSGGSPWQLTRTSDFNEAATPIAQNTYVFVTGGVTNVNTGWVLLSAVTQISPPLATPGTSDVNFGQFSSASINAGNGITIVGNTVSVNNLAADLTFTGLGELQVNPAGLSSGKGGTGVTSLTGNRVLIGQGGILPVDLTKTAPTGDFVGTSDNQALTTKTITDTSNTIRAKQLEFFGDTTVTLNTAAGPTGANEALVSTGVGAAGWTSITSFPQTQPDRTFLVSPSGGTHTTIAAALVTINALVPVPSIVNPVVLLIGPGIYNETNPLVIPSGVSVRGTGTLLPAQITPINANQAIFQLNTYTEINGLTIANATDTGGIGVEVLSGSIANCAYLQIIDCETGVLCQGPSTAMILINSLINRTSSYVHGTDVIGVEVTSGAVLSFVSSRVQGSLALPIDIGVRVSGTGGGVGSTIRSLYANVFYCRDGMIVENGAAGQEAFFSLQSGKVQWCTGVALTVGANARMESYSTIVEALLSTDSELDLTSTSSTFLGSGNRIRSDRVSRVTGSTLVCSAITTKSGDEGQYIMGELHVGTVDNPAETVLGGGDSFTDNLRVFTVTPALVYTDRTAAASEKDATYFPAFDGVAAGNMLYIGHENTVIGFGFPGVKLVDIATTIDLGTGSIVWEYWNGVAWVSYYIMSTVSGPPYNTKAQQVFSDPASGDEQVYFGDMDSWTTTTVNGVDGWWVRVQIVTDITTAPILNQIKLYPKGRWECNDDGFVQFYGTAEPRKFLPFDINLMRSAIFTGSGIPGDTNVFVSGLLGAGRILNSFGYTGPPDSIGASFDLPPDMDTSHTLDICVRWFTETGTGGNILLEAHNGFITDYADNSGSVSDIFTTTSAAPATGPNEQQIQTVVLANPANKLITTKLSLSFADAISRRPSPSCSDHAFFVLRRMSGDPLDTHNGVIYIVNISINYRAWNHGEYNP